MKRERGFSLVELLFVVAIIGLLAAIAVPNLLAAINRSRQKRTMADMRTFATAWESRATELNRYSAAGLSWPATLDDATLVAAFLVPTYIQTIPTRDGWSNPLRVGTSADGQSYAIKSFGANRIDDTPGLTSVAAPIATSRFDCDIILSNGLFIMYPEGIQSQ
ncbi:MAG TPA: prepilin-type N-terminal cleavage/methylation domain-containing protein [Thermoanaerobaculia bacterium]